MWSFPIHIRLIHLHRIHGLRLADHAQVVLLTALHLVLAVLLHRPGDPLPVRTLSLGRHGRDTNFSVRFGVGDLAVAVAVVGLLASGAFAQVVAALLAVEALEDGDPHGFHLPILGFRLGFCRPRLLGADCGRAVCGVCFGFDLFVVFLPC